MSKTFLRNLAEYKSTKESAEKQMREIALGSAISSIKNEEEYLKSCLNITTIIDLLASLKKERFEDYESWIRIGFILFTVMK